MCTYPVPRSIEQFLPDNVETPNQFSAVSQSSQTLKQYSQLAIGLLLRLYTLPSSSQLASLSVTTGTTKTSSLSSSYSRGQDIE